MAHCDGTNWEPPSEHPTHLHLRVCKGGVNAGVVAAMCVKQLEHLLMLFVSVLASVPCVEEACNTMGQVDSISSSKKAMPSLLPSVEFTIMQHEIVLLLNGLTLLKSFCASLLSFTG